MADSILTSDVAPLCLRPESLRPGNRVTLLRDGAEAYPPMLAAIRCAMRSVYLETYIFADDPTGRRFADALAERARAGVEVRVIYDAVGCFSTSREFFGVLRAAGARVVEFHPVLLSFQGFSYRRRDHRKLLVIDGREAFLGGLNIGREYDSPEHGGLGWRDTHARVEGPIVGDLTALFAELWNASRRGADPPVVPAPEPEPVVGGAPALATSSFRFRDRWEIGRLYLHAIRQAKKRIWIANPYFIPTRKVRTALRQAVRRGVDVRILLPGHSDSTPILYAIQHLYARYLRWGIRLFEWPGPMMHAKTAVVDGAWSTVGSYNFDHMSLFRNHELALVVPDAGFGARMDAMFEEDLSRAREVDREEWRKRPWRRKVLEGLFHAFRLLM